MLENFFRYETSLNSCRCNDTVKTSAFSYSKCLKQTPKNNILKLLVSSQQRKSRIICSDRGLYLVYICIQMKTSDIFTLNLSACFELHAAFMFEIYRVK